MVRYKQLFKITEERLQRSSHFRGVLVKEIKANCIYALSNFPLIIFTSWYDVSHAMGFRVWGRNSIKNHSLTLLDINLCIKPGLDTFSPPP